MAATLKKDVGHGLGRLDESYDGNDLYESLKAMANQLNTLTAQFNQLLTDYNASTTPSGASAVTSEITVE